MNRINRIECGEGRFSRLLRQCFSALTVIVLTGCFSHAAKSPATADSPAAKSAAEAEKMRGGLDSQLASLEADPELASRAPSEIKSAEAAVAAAHESHSDAVLAAHLVYLADRKVKLARAVAETKLADDHRAALAAQRDEIRARADVQAAEAARARAQQAQAEIDGLRQQVGALQPVQVGRTMTLLLPEVLLEPGHISLTSEVSSGLDAVAASMARHPEWSIRLEGRTPGRANDDFALRMSQSRADGVRNYLRRHDVPEAQVHPVVGLAGETVTAADGTAIPCNRCVLATISGLPLPLSADTP